MSGAADSALQRALTISAQMLDAADRDDWSRVADLDVERQTWMRQEHPANKHSSDALAALHEHNRLLLERAELAHMKIEQQLGQHKYNHRALNTYIASAG